MSSVSPDPAAARRTFANVAASSSISIQSPVVPAIRRDDDEHTSVTGPTNGVQPNMPHLLEHKRVTPAIPKKLSPAPRNLAGSPSGPPFPGPNIMVQSPGASAEGHDLLSGPLPSAVSDENSTQLSSSDSSAKPASLDGKSVASATTFAMDEKESIRPDDSASVKAIEDDDIYSPPVSTAIGSTTASETGARAFRDQLQEITSMGAPARVSVAVAPSRPDSRSVPNEALLYNPSALPGSGQLPGYDAQSSQDVLGKPADFPPDQKLLEAINSPRDRIWVLKLEQDIIDFVKDSKEAFVDLPQCNSFYRMLAHKLADYYLLGHAVDGSVTAVRLYRTPTCRIAPPLTALTNPSTASNTPPPSAPQVQILRRGGEAPAMSKSTSDAGDSDSEKNKPLTREEREQRYEQARLRIMGSAKPEADALGFKERDESRSSSVAGKKKPKKQRTNSEDGFEARSAYSTFNPQSSYAPSGTPENGTPAAYYPTYHENGAGMYNGSNGFAPQTYSAVYGQTMPSQVQYPWLQQGYSGYADSNGQQWDQTQHNGNDLATDFQRTMSFQSPNPQGPTHVPTMGGQYGFPSQPQQQQHHHQATPPWSSGAPFQQNYPSAVYSQYASSDRPASSASHSSQYGYGMPGNHMPGQHMGYGNAVMNGAFQRGSFNPQSQAFIPGYQGTSSPQHFMPGIGPNAGGYNSFGPAQSLQRQNSTHSQASSYGGQRSNNDNGNMRASSGMTHPLPQPVFSPNVPMPYQGQKQQQSTPARSTSSNGPTERSPGSVNAASASTIAKWGTPASLPAKPPPPANDSYDMSRLAGQRAPGFNTAAAARLPGMGKPGYHSLPTMAAMRGGAAGQSTRGGQ